MTLPDHPDHESDPGTPETPPGAHIFTLSPADLGILSQADTTADTRVDGSPIVDVERWPNSIPKMPLRPVIRHQRERG